MSDFENLLSLIESDDVKQTSGIRDMLGKWFYTGMSDFECLHGTLGAGFEHVSDASKFTQALREIYSRRGAIIDWKSNVLEAQADMLEAQEELDKADTESKKLRAQAKIIRAKNKFQQAEDSIKDNLRQLKVFSQAAKELMPTVSSQYPNIEAAQKDIWKKKSEFRVLKRLSGYDEHLPHVALDAVESAKLGVKYGVKELEAPLRLEHDLALNQLAGGDTVKLVNIIEEQCKIKERITQNKQGGLHE